MSREALIAEIESACANCRALGPAYLNEYARELGIAWRATHQIQIWVAYRTRLQSTLVVSLQPDGSAPTLLEAARGLPPTWRCRRTGVWIYRDTESLDAVVTPL